VDTQKVADAQEKNILLNASLQKRMDTAKNVYIKYGTE
jgi:hypothetical protein